MDQGRIVKVSGPLVVAEGLLTSRMYDLVRVGEEGLMGEIIEMRKNRCSIQVYEETEGLGPGHPVMSTGAPLSVELGPGMLGAVYDGVQRPLDVLQARAGAFLTRGVSAPGLDREKTWAFHAHAREGDHISGGDVIGVVQENEVISHKVMAPPNVTGRIESISDGIYTVDQVIGQVLEESSGKVVELKLMQRWPVRVSRPYLRRLPVDSPLVSGTRVIDTFFPLLKGGVACIPGPFGAGKTVTQHQIAKWANAEIVIFIGCGERGNEMTDVLMEFPELHDPRTGQPLMKRTVLVANTSNMPVAAREASVYTGVTMAEYFRDMGYNVVLQADSTSRWAEAMREISGRLEEMPGEEGFPAYLGTKLAAFYERAGKVVALGSRSNGAPSTHYDQERAGSVSIVGSVSPPGGDLSEPVVQNTLRVVKVFWALQDTLAYQRHFPAIDWLTSYSLYFDKAAGYWDDNVSKEFRIRRDRAMAILQRESELAEIARLVGMDALSPEEQILMEVAKSVREDFLQQNAFREDDQFTSLRKQDRLLQIILHFYDRALMAYAAGAPLGGIFSAPVREKIARAKYTLEDEEDAFAEIISDIETQLVADSSEEGNKR